MTLVKFIALGISAAFVGVLIGIFGIYENEKGRSEGFAQGQAQAIADGCYQQACSKTDDIEDILVGAFE